MDKNAKFKMIETVERGQMNAGLTFGYVDVPKVITEKHRPFLNELTAASLALQQEIREELHTETRDVEIPCEYGNIKARVYIPEGEGPFPLILHYHGGGFAIRDIECFEFISQYYCIHTPAVIVTPEYDLAPEKKFPTQVEQCYAALLWARAHAEEYQANPEKDVVTGDSAGGNLSTVISMMCRDRGVRMPKLQILAYPVVDNRIGMNRESEKLYGEHYNLDLKHMESYTLAYVEKEEDIYNPYASPLLAESLEDLPPCKIIFAQCDCLVDQGMEYVMRLKEAGVPVEYVVYKGVPHDFMFYGFPESYAAYEQVCKWINESVNK